jgi:preprotein translocase subunit SecY
MGWKEAAEPILARMPVVRRPESHVPFKRKLAWTAGVLVLYFFLTNVALWGLPAGDTGTNPFGQFRSVIAGSQGSLLQVGIGPIVTASIVLQLLSGANLLGLDTDDPRDQILYQGLQKLLVFVVALLTAIPMVYGGFIQPAESGYAGFSTQALELFLIAQMFAGGVLILYMDEIVSKWGVGSGVGLFIIAGVSQRLFGGLFAFNDQGFFYSWYLILTGQVEIGSLIGGGGLQAILLSPGNLVALFTTVLIFVIVVYAESVRVEIPLSHARVKGARGRFPVKLIYASVLPMILVRALQANVQFLGQIMNARWPSSIPLWSGWPSDMPDWLGVYGRGQPVDGLFYYLAPIYNREAWTSPPSGIEAWEVALRIGMDVFIMVVGGAIFAIFWVETTDMGPESTAKQIQNSGMQIPGFRQDVGVVEKVMARYIPQVTVIGGALVGLLAVAANMLGAIGNVSGTGLLLTVSITYKLYEEIAEEQLMEMHPMMRQMFGND